MMDKKQFLLLDGAMGTMLQKAGLKPGHRPEVFGLEHPQIVEQIHRSYIESGSRVIYANTFGVNSRKLEGCRFSVKELITANIAAAKKAAAAAREKGVKVALDVGPIGELMEPLGTISFDEAYECFKDVVTAGENAGADLVVFETMTDLNEVRAAVLAAKENTSLSVWVTMTFEQNGRTFTGTIPEAMALTLDCLGVDAIGVNCSLGPAELIPIVEKIRSHTNKMLIVKPNAGLPDPRSGLYAMTPERFAKEMNVYLQMGIPILGGCCGTRPAFIDALRKTIEDTGAECGSGLDNDFFVNDNNENTKDLCAINGVCSASRFVPLDGHVHVVGERINPTGKKRFQQALRESDMNYVKRCAIEQADAGADILDINVGLPGADEASLMADVVRAVQSVTDLPLQIDSSHADAIEAGLRAACGRVIVNSVNADEETCRKILPIVKKYGACVVGLALRKSGLPQNARERIGNVRRILQYTDEYRIPRQDVVIDCLALTVSAQQDQAMETLRAVQYVRQNFGVHCTLGVSNISFGLPMRTYATISFLTQAMFCGTDLPIINPNQVEVMDAVASFRALSGQDPSCLSYIERFADRKRISQEVPSGKLSLSAGLPGESSNPSSYIRQAVLRGMGDEVRTQTAALLEKMDAMEIIEQELIPALDEVGDKYEKQILFLPQLINAANAASKGFELIKDHIAKTGGEEVSKGKVILATVEGDVHDIGKNIVKVVLENYGFTVIDLGRDVPPEKILDTARKENVKLVGLSALMTTTLPAMERTIRLLKQSGCPAKTVVGGAVVTAQYASSVGADYYARDAKETVDAAREVYSE